jgi:hypothetical protein
METTPLPQHLIRLYRPEDRPILRAICADTGFLGQPIDPVFEDRELFADYLTSYYTDAEPESTLVCELNGEVKGYLMGCRFPKRKDRFEHGMLPGLVLRGLWRYFTRPYNTASRQYVRWILTQARKENPFTPPDIPHFISTSAPRRVASLPPSNWSTPSCAIFTNVATNRSTPRSLPTNHAAEAACSPATVSASSTNGK